MRWSFVMRNASFAVVPGFLGLTFAALACFVSLLDAKRDVLSMYRELAGCAFCCVPVRGILMAFLAVP